MWRAIKEFSGLPFTTNAASPTLANLRFQESRLKNRCAQPRWLCRLPSSFQIPSLVFFSAHPDSLRCLTVSLRQTRLNPKTFTRLPRGIDCRKTTARHHRPRPQRIHSSAGRSRLINSNSVTASEVTHGSSRAKQAPSPAPSSPPATQPRPGQPRRNAGELRLFRGRRQRRRRLLLGRPGHAVRAGVQRLHPDRVLPIGILRFPLPFLRAGGPPAGSSSQGGWAVVWAAPNRRPWRWRQR